MNLFPTLKANKFVLHRVDSAHQVPSPNLAHRFIDNKTSFLNEVESILNDESMTHFQLLGTMSHLYQELNSAREIMAEQQWKESILACREHPVCKTLHQDPFTFRAFDKPRGYAGDAVLLDYIYGREEQWELPEMSDVGRRIHLCTTVSSACEGVKSRRGYVAEMIDRFTEAKPEPEVLSVACGHLREAGLSSTVIRGRIGRFVGVDVDRESLKEVQKCYGRFGVEPVSAEVRELISGKLDIGTFDLVYSTGLYDYLNQSIGARLAAKLFERTRPGGKMLIANFLPGVECVGYMETFMDWNLIYRTRMDMVALTDRLPESEIKRLTVFSEENQNVINLIVEKNG